MSAHPIPSNPVRPLPKTRTGIRGLDDITQGGLPRGRTTLICGAAGCGKSLLAMEFLFRGATEFNEPGVLVAFEETKSKISANGASLGFDLDRLIARKKLVVDYVHVDRSEIEETGEYDLGGLFARLEHHIKTTRARRVVLDTIEVLFAGLNNQALVRSEIRRLFRWLEERNLTAIITTERGEGQLTRFGLEEYVSDCVILLDHRVDAELSTRRLRVVKYRGSGHGTNEYPFLIDDQGVSVLPLTTLGLAHKATQERVSTGVPELDAMMDAKGFFRGGTVLVSGTAGTGKSSLAASFAATSCERGERTIYFSMEESPEQILRNMRSIGIRLDPWCRKGLLQIQAFRPSMYGLEMHLVNLHKHIEAFKPRSIVLDPVTSLLAVGKVAETRSLLIRLIDHLKGLGITAYLTSLTTSGGAEEDSEVGISSLIDAWIVLGDSRVSGERNRTLQIVKSRGMAHSNQIREFLLTSQGVELLDVYLGHRGMLTGSARVAQESLDRAEAAGRILDAERQQVDFDIEEKSLSAQISSLQAKQRFLGNERERLSRHATLRKKESERDRRIMAESRKAGRALGVPAGSKEGLNGR